MTPKHAPAHSFRARLGRPFGQAAFWLLPMLAVLAVGVIGTALYLGGLSSPDKHFKEFPIAVINEDQGASVPQADGKKTQENLGSDLVRKFVDKANEEDKIDLRELTMDQARDQLDRGELYAAVVVPDTFSKDTVSLIEGSLTRDNAARPEVTVYTDPQAGSLGTRLATGAVEPGVQEASKKLGEQLTQSVAPAEEQAYDQVLQQLQESQQAQAQQLQRSAAQGGPEVQQFAQQVQKSQEGSAEQIAKELSPTVSSVARDTLKDPVSVVSKAYNDLPEGTALGMSAFYYSILLLVVGFSGSVALNLLMDARMGMAAFEMGPFFRDYQRAVLPRPVGFLMKWLTFVVAAAPTSALMMWVASTVGMPVPHGFLVFLLGWLAMSTVSAIVLTLIAVGGSVGMLLCLVYLVFMGLPSAGAVVPLQAVPEFFRAIAPIEPLHHIFTSLRSALFFDAIPEAGLTTGLIGLFVMLAVALAVGLLGGWGYDRWKGLRGDVTPAKHSAQAQAPSGEEPDVKIAENPSVPGHASA
ncbi:DUF3533 domain-containing protein [Kocuria tytonis]|uniref:DUF3533 domain-containing protein n=1 Tax=Kocuria tytonis TaxID=2054280 RepID=A0A495A6A1_9MICC|nr:DUF3533 domain-containing protein [Kocuria tytonis]RKQ35373.1 DUF3533 domain-containing protein [Kocuria tytonis]